MRLTAPILALSALACLAQPMPTDRLKRVEAAVEAERVRQGVVGMTAAVSVRGAITWVSAFGKSDLENDFATKPETLFRTGSLAKPITAVAALQLWERGKLDLDVPVQNYVPAFPEKPWKVTVRMLLGHLGGIRHYEGDEIDSTKHYSTITAPLRIFSVDPLAHEPRTKYLYSSYGYNLAGAAVEGAARMPFMEYLRENILTPAKMSSTRDDNAREIVPNRTRWYSRTRDGRVINANLADTSNKVPGGGLVTTVEDLLRFAAAWQQEKLLKRATMQMQAEPQKLASGTPTVYGLGWNVAKIAGRPSVSHSGSQQGCKTILAMFPESGLAVAVMTNSDFAEPAQFVEVILKTLDSIGGVVTRPH